MTNVGRKEIIIRILIYIKKYMGYLAITIILALATVGMTLYIPIQIGRAIDHIIYDQVNFGVIGKIIKTIVLFVLLTALAQWFMNIIYNKITYHIIRDMRNDAFEKIEILPIKYVDSHSHGQIVSRVIADVDQFAEGLLMGFTQLFTGILTIVGTLVIMLIINKSITLVVVMITPLSLFAANLIAKKTFLMFQLQSESRGEQTAYIDEMIGNAKTVKAFGYEHESQKIFGQMNEQLRKYSMRAIFFSSLTFPTTRFINGLVYAGVALVGAYAVISGGLTVGILSSLLGYANQYTKPFNEISGVITELQNAIACAGRIFELIDETPQQEEDKNAIHMTIVAGDVACRDVSFSYRKEEKFMEHLNIYATAGQRIAIVGPTGCGKTTFINLLMRFYEMDEGQIAIDGIDIRKMSRKSLRKSFGMVLQDTWLREGTIKDNITMGKVNATREEIIAAAKAAHADSFIRRLPQGYETVIGEDGGILSQGQQQLLCIARVMLSRPPMLILDEATSSIDTRTEEMIQSAFLKLMEGRTSFIVAHRLSTVRNADIIIVMKDGKIVEQGNHRDLLTKKGFYSQLYYS